MNCTRRLAMVSVLVGLAGLVEGCSSGPNSRLVTVRSSGDSPNIDFTVKNLSGVPINSLFLAKTEAVNAAGQDLDDNSPAGQTLWGADLMVHAALADGDRQPIAVPEPGLWDVRVLDRDSRYQHVTGLHLAAGGRYILELNPGGWRAKR